VQRALIHQPRTPALPSTFRVPLHYADAVADHEPAAGLLRDRSRERGAGQGERAADCQRGLLRFYVGMDVGEISGRSRRVTVE